jgi:hypothetical protein
MRPFLQVFLKNTLIRVNNTLKLRGYFAACVRNNTQMVKPSVPAMKLWDFKRRLPALPCTASGASGRHTARGVALAPGAVSVGNPPAMGSHRAADGGGVPRTGSAGARQGVAGREETATRITPAKLERGSLQLGAFSQRQVAPPLPTTILRYWVIVPYPGFSEFCIEFGIL